MLAGALWLWAYGVRPEMPAGSGVGRHYVAGVRTSAGA